MNNQQMTGNDIVPHYDYDGFLVTGPRSEHLRPMWMKMFQRAGMDPQRVQFLDPSLVASKVASNRRIQSVFTLGEDTLTSLTGETDLFRFFGRKLLSKRFGRTVQIVPLQSPSLLLPRRSDDDDPPRSQLYHRPARFQGLWVRHLQHGLKPYEADAQKFYLVDPTYSIWIQWVKDALDSGLPISTDIETAYKMKVESEEDYEEEELQTGAMLRISFSYKPHHAISVYWGAPYLDGIRRLLAEPSASIWWNGILFDIPRLKKEGFPVHSTAYDYQDGWHMLQSDLPRGLEFVSSIYTRQLPWKHLNSSAPGLYSCIDADVALQNAIGIKRDLEENNQWNIFVEDSVELMPILVRAGERGNKIDLPYSIALKKEMIDEKARIVETAASMAPIEIRPRKHYKRTPEAIREHIPEDILRLPTSGYQIQSTSGELFESVSVVVEAKVCSVCGARVGNFIQHLKGGKKNPCKVAGAVAQKAMVDAVEWDLIEPFNLGSSDQIKEYIRFHKHPMGQDRKTKKDSANAKHIAKLAAKYGDTHPLYREKLREAKLTKVIGTYVYCDRADATGFIHSTYINSPSTWRLAARNENLTNVGKREGNPWAVRARRQIIAREGHIFVQADSTSIEAVVTGYFLGDPTFIDIAKKSIHAYFVCREVGWEFNDANIEKVKAEYKGLYNQFKTAIYLLLYGGDPFLMFMENPDTFKSEAGARLIQDKIFQMLPALKDWHDNTRAQAKKEGFLVGPWGHRHYFYDVHTFKKNSKGEFMFEDDGRPKLKLGQDAKKALAFRPQNAAAKFGRDTLRLIGNSRWGQWMPANVFVHDGYCLEVPESDKEEAGEFLIQTLTRVVPELGGLRIGCELEYGYNWADVDKAKKIFTDGNPTGMRTIKKVEV